MHQIDRFAAMVLRQTLLTDAGYVDTRVLRTCAEHLLSGPPGSRFLDDVPEYVALSVAVRQCIADVICPRVGDGWRPGVDG